MIKQLSDSFIAAYGRPPEVISRAPGRIEFIGNHTDYNGGPVLGAAVDRYVWVGLAIRDDHVRRFASDGQRTDTRVELRDDSIRKLTGARAWANYPLGVLASMPSFGFRPPEGFDFLAASDLPSGAGLSSSAAIELASALCFLAITGQGCARDVLAKMGRKAENDFVGVPCGILDQGVSAFGRPDHLVHIDCRTQEFAHVPLPADVSFWIFDTHKKHALVDGMYARRHAECMRAATALGVGLLADASTELLDEREKQMGVVEAMRARHVVEEVARVNATVAALKDGRIDRAGEYLTASHRSSQHLFENSAVELDVLVDILSATPNVHGARLTGGGFGGAVLAVTNQAFVEEHAAVVADKYANRFESRPGILRLLSGSGAEILLNRSQ